MCHSKKKRVNRNKSLKKKNCSICSQPCEAGTTQKSKEETGGACSQGNLEEPMAKRIKRVQVRQSHDKHPEPRTIQKELGQYQDPVIWDRMHHICCFYLVSQCIFVYSIRIGKLRSFNQNWRHEPYTHYMFPATCWRTWMHGSAFKV